MQFLAVIGIGWPIFVIVGPPEFISGFLDPIVLTVCMWVCMIGSITALWGYASSQCGGKLGVIGVSIELAGLILAIVGPLSYVVTRIFLLLSPESIGLTTTMIFAYAILSIFIYRLATVIPRFRLEAYDPTKE